MMCAFFGTPALGAATQESLYNWKEEAHKQKRVEGQPTHVGRVAYYYISN